MKYLRNTKKNVRFPLPVVIIADILLVGLVLVCFALDHHVVPKIRAEMIINNMQNAVNPSVQPSIPVETNSTEVLESVYEDPTTEPDNRTEWQKRFADKFSDVTEITDFSYKSPEVSITVDKVVTGEGRQKITYYVADIYVASVENFKTYTPHGKMVYFDTQKAEDMVMESNAIIAISGDFLTYQKNGFLVRNGEVYTSNRNFSICVLFPDGVMETYDAGSYNIDDILARDPVHVWSFGPVLLNQNGEVRDKYDVSTAVSYTNPRCGIGYYEPGHYCFVTVDGRQDHSKGMLIEELAQVFADLGCKVAYNLDGGGTSVMLFNGERISKQSNGQRDLGDILLITESGFSLNTEEGN